MTPVGDMREGSVISSAGSSARKPRQNLDEHDHLLVVKYCLEQRGHYKDGSKAHFWGLINAAFLRDTGKTLAQMSATVGRLVESRRRQIADWEAGIIPQKPSGELNDKLDEWMEFLKTEDGDAEEQRTRQVGARRRTEEQRKEARRQAIAAEQLAHAQGQQMGAMEGPPQSQSTADMGQPDGEHQMDMNGYRPHKRRRRDDQRQLSQELQNQFQQQQEEVWAYAQAHPPEPPRRVVVEGAMTKEDWRDVMGNDARLRALETKVDKIELLVCQNNKLLLQLVQNQNNKDRNEEERVPVHLDAEFERDYL